MSTRKDGRIATPACAMVRNDTVFSPARNISDILCPFQLLIRIDSYGVPSGQSKKIKKLLHAFMKCGISRPFYFNSIPEGDTTTVHCQLSTKLSTKQQFIAPLKKSGKHFHAPDFFIFSGVFPKTVNGV